MILDKKVAVVIPAYNIGDSILKFLESIPNYIDKIYLIDDCCPLKTGEVAKKSYLFNKKLSIFVNISFLISISSKTASITISASFITSQSRVGVRRLILLSIFF